MVSCKNLVLLAAIGLAVAVSIASASNYVIGNRQPGDYQACYGSVDIRAQYNQVVQAERYCNLGYGVYITQVYAHDRGYYGRGGYASVIRGGLGQRNVTVQLWSQISQPLNFTIYVYAKRGPYAKNVNTIPLPMKP